MALFRGVLLLSGMEINDAAKVMKHLRIWHPYGTVGPAPYELLDQEYYLGFPQSEPNWQEVLFGVRGLRTFMEGLDDAELRNAMHAALRDAEQIVFLGFSFLDQNMELLKVQAKENTKVYATCVGLSELDRERATNRLIETLLTDLDTGSRRSEITMIPKTASETFDAWGNYLRS